MKLLYGEVADPYTLLDYQEKKDWSNLNAECFTYWFVRVSCWYLSNIDLDRDDQDWTFAMALQG